MKRCAPWRSLWAVAFGMFVLAGCASIPAEAPMLSKELGNRISALEQANLTLLKRFFDLKRAEVDRFLQDEWVPVFAKEVFEDPLISRTWDTIVRENNAKDKLTFLLILGPKLQGKMNSKRLELITPLDDIERRVADEIEQSYNQARSINNTLTSFLLSASKVDESRQRYLDMIGVTDEKLGKTIDDVDEAVNNLVGAVGSAQEKTKQAEKYYEKLKSIRERL